MRFLAVLLAVSPVLAQTILIVPSTAPSGGTGSLLATIDSPSGKEPVALQWDLMLGPEVRLAATDIGAGEAATKAGKTAYCVSLRKTENAGGLFRCLLVGGTKPIANGVIIAIKYKVQETAAPQIVPVRISNAIAVVQHDKKSQKVVIDTAEGTLTVR